MLMLGHCDAQLLANVLKGVTEHAMPNNSPQPLKGASLDHLPDDMFKLVGSKLD